MSLADVFGTFDPAAAFVAIGMGAGTTLVTCVAMLRPSAKDKQRKFDLEVLQYQKVQTNSDQIAKYQHEQAMTKINNEKEVQLERIRSAKLIEVHREGENGDHRG